MPFNREMALEYLGDDEEIFEELVKTFLKNYSFQAEQLELAVGNRDSKNIEHYAHSLKGASANFFYDDLTKHLLKMELMGKNNDLDDVEAEYSILKELLSNLVKALS